MIVIVYGALRSGTTLLRLMLDAHPQITCPGETDFLFDHLEKGAKNDSVIDREALARDRIYQSSGVRLDPELDGPEAVHDMVRQLGHENADVLVLMLHRGLSEALRLFPEARVLHMLRDPRDVARSAIGMGWAGTEYHGVVYWMRTEADWDAAMNMHPGTLSKSVRYEDLIGDPQGTLEGVCAFCGLDYDPAMLGYAESSSYSPPDVALVEQWRKKQTPRSVGLVEARLGPLLAARGYAASGHPPVHPGPIGAAHLWLKNKRAVWRLRIARYGLIDPLLVGLERRLGIRGLSAGAHQRMNRKQIEYLK